MRYLYIILYNLVFYPLIIIGGLIGSIFIAKFREGIIGRRKTNKLLKKYLATSRSEPVYWFHSASHGEYLQAKPVIAGIKDIVPGATIIASFFSPSGYNNVHDENIDIKVYLPFDFIWSVRRMVKIARPKKIIFAAYDIWPNLVWTAYYRHIPTTIFAAHFIKGTTKLKPVLKSFYRSVYESIPFIYTITKDDFLNLEKIVRPHRGPRIRVLGNPRYDEVKSQADLFTERHTISVLLRTRRLVVGSVWPEDQAVIFEPIRTLLEEHPQLKLLWVPHEPSPKYVTEYTRLFREAGLEPAYYKTKKIKAIPDAKVVIVTSIGVLSRLYWQGQFAYVGGGFSTGVHNVMEPAIARLPVLFGPKNQNSPEAQALIAAGGGKAITTSDEFYQAISLLLNDKNAFLNASLAATDVIHKNLGSATRVVRSILRD